MTINGSWPKNDIRRAFVAGAKWWEFEKTGATMWQSDRNKAEIEANRRYPNGKVYNEIETCSFCGSDWEVNEDANDPDFKLGEPVCCPEAQEEWAKNKEG